MEVSHQPIDHPETVARRDKNIRITFPCPQTSAGSRRFQRTHRSGTNSPYPLTSRFRLLNHRYRCLWHFKPFTVHFMFGNIVHPNRLKSTRANV